MQSTSSPHLQFPYAERCIASTGGIAGVEGSEGARGGAVAWHRVVSVDVECAPGMYVIGKCTNISYGTYHRRGQTDERTWPRRSDTCVRPGASWRAPLRPGARRRNGTHFNAAISQCITGLHVMCYRFEYGIRIVFICLNCNIVINTSPVIIAGVVNKTARFSVKNQHIKTKQLGEQTAVGMRTMRWEKYAVLFTFTDLSQENFHPVSRGTSLHVFIAPKIRYST